MSGSKHSLWGCVWGQDQTGWDTLGLIQESSSSRGWWCEQRADLFSQSQLPEGWCEVLGDQQEPPQPLVWGLQEVLISLWEAPAPQGRYYQDSDRAAVG